MAGLGAIAVAIIASVCALALGGLAAMTAWAARAGSPRAPLVVGGLIISALALGGALVAPALILLDDRRRAAPRPRSPGTPQHS